MRVRRVEIQNFRGIKSLDLRVPADKKFVCLIGPGDSTKSTILEAIHLALGERWSLNLSDTDFYGSDIDQPLVIRVALADLPAEIKGHTLLGLHRSGIDADGEWTHDPSDDVEECVIVQLRVDREMDPSWTIFRPGGAEETIIGTGIRRKFSVFKIDDRIDNHLRWTRTSALTRLTDSTHGTAATLATALVAARAAVSSSVTPELQALTDSIGARMSELGSGDFSDLKPGLDTSLASSGGNLALFEGDVPLTSFGLGTRRLAGIATQQMASIDKSVILVDEVEHGLEPHRLVHLLKHLRSDSQHAQVFVTTHSPVAVEQLDSSDLAIIRCDAGAAVGRFVPADLQFAQATLRGGPSAFLAKRVLVTEGKTEFGLLLGMIDDWDRHAVSANGPTSAANGVAVTNGGGSMAADRAKVLAQFGYETALVVDNDDRSIDTKVTAATAEGVKAFRWQTGNATEDELVSGVAAPLLTQLLQVAIETRVDDITVKSDLLNARTSEPVITGLDVEYWIATDGFTVEQARSLIARAAKKSKWFKDIQYGRTLSTFVIANATIYRDLELGKKLLEIKEFIYPLPPSSPATGKEES